MTIFNASQGVGVAGTSWTFHAATAAASPAAGAHIAIPRKRHAAAARVASVNRGTT